MYHFCTIVCPSCVIGMFVSSWHPSYHISVEALQYTLASGSRASFWSEALGDCLCFWCFSGIKWGTSSSHKQCTTTYLHSPTRTTLQSMQGGKNTLSTPTHTETNNRPSHSTDAPLRQALGWAVNSQTSKSLNHGVWEPTKLFRNHCDRGP